MPRFAFLVAARSPLVRWTMVQSVHRLNVARPTQRTILRRRYNHPEMKRLPHITIPNLESVHDLRMFSSYGFSIVEVCRPHPHLDQPLRLHSHLIDLSIQLNADDTEDIACSKIVDSLLQLPVYPESYTEMSQEDINTIVGSYYQVPTKVDVY